MTTTDDDAMEAALAAARIDMTPPEATTALLALTALQDRIAHRITEIKEDAVADWSAGSKITVNLPGDRPNKFRKVGEVRQDGGQETAVISDRDAWESWVREHVPTEVLTRPVPGNRHVIDLDSQEALVAAVVEGDAVASGFGRNENVARAALTALEARGWTLARLVPDDTREEIAPAFEVLTLSASRDAGTPVTVDGEIPDGVTVTNAAPRPVVVLTAKRDPALVDEWIGKVRADGQLAAILEGAKVAIGGAQ